MFLPLGDEPNPRGVPVVTYALLGLNIAVFLLVTLPLSAMRPDFDDPLLAEYVQALATLRFSVDDVLEFVSAYDLIVFSYGFRPSDPDGIALFTSMFLHSGFMHLAGNMLFLWIYGDNVEHRLGRGRFLLAYLGTGVLATSSHAFLDLSSVLPMVGASGAISGVLGFYFVWFPKNRVRLWVMLFPFFMNVIYAPARFVLGMYLVVDNLQQAFLLLESWKPHEHHAVRIRPKVRLQQLSCRSTKHVCAISTTTISGSKSESANRIPLIYNAKGAPRLTSSTVGEATFAGGQKRAKQK